MKQLTDEELKKLHPFLTQGEATLCLACSHKTAQAAHDNAVLQVIEELEVLSPLVMKYPRKMTKDWIDCKVAIFKDQVKG